MRQPIALSRIADYGVRTRFTPPSVWNVQMSFRTRQLLVLTLPVLALMGCSIENDVPEFKAPAPNTAEMPAPELVPTADLLVASPAEDEDYEQTISAVDSRKKSLLRRAGAL
jgi:hypothetical protein